MPSKLLIWLERPAPATWNGNEEDLVPTDYTDKLAYFKKKYGSPSPDINLIRETFKVFDSNSDGLINADEMKPTTIGFEEIPDDALKQMFQKVDKNQDGRSMFQCLLKSIHGHLHLKTMHLVLPKLRMKKCHLNHLPEQICKNRKDTVHII